MPPETNLDATRPSAIVLRDRPVMGFGAGGFLLLAAIPLSALAGGYLGTEFAARPLRDAIATRPPVLIVDVAGALEGVAPEDVGEAIANLRSTAARLADGGVLVLDAQAVLAAPQDAYVLSGKQP
ncbi:hypothetical protein [Thiocapsa marina]|uniref:CHASE2 domain-containing protein n=1 Tax=Thiocapsa marina 5811 TaxID=768671 RepID=F9UHS3_9GAMM|nr:hypothetical protein [Thiocapsa marina]EGV16249.1 hypothetical protein ThimaDRAFT_4476 [Thiocapsa marina 5811]